MQTAGAAGTGAAGSPRIQVPEPGDRVCQIPQLLQAQPQAQTALNAWPGAPLLLQPQPVLPVLVERELLAHRVQHSEVRIQPRFQGAFPQQAGGEGVDRLNVRGVHLLHGLPQPIGLPRIRPREGRVELTAHAATQLPRRFLREGDGHHLPQLRPALPHHLEEAPDQDRGLARPRSGLEKDRGVQVLDRAVPDVLIRGDRRSRPPHDGCACIRRKSRTTVWSNRFLCSKRASTSVAQTLK